ncbi:MAG: biotin transporter BioY [Defluviitaleaceae bacterium]|nr:biotin transporter BioY [Defluviitaleaceae bacterium]
MSHQQPTAYLRVTVYCALFTALIIIGSYMSFPLPLSPVPIVLADFFIMVSALFLGWKSGLMSVILYLVLGAIGLPVFAGGASGLASFFGPTGGFLFGYLLLVASIGFITEKMKSSIGVTLIALLVGNVLLYAAGVTWLKVVLELSWSGALAAGLTPFLPGTLIKIIVAVAIGQVLVPPFKANMKRW